MSAEQSRPFAPSKGANYKSTDPSATTAVVPVQRRRKRRWWHFLLLVVVLFLLLFAATGFLLYKNPPLLNSMSGLFLHDQKGVVGWNGTDPLNILLMGIDQRTTEQTRSDSMIILHIDPATSHATMLSVPRDLWVDMPGDYGYYKLNAAYALGGTQGPQFAQLAVETTLGVPINYYAVIKFEGFKKIVDALGGITVCVPTALHDDAYPDDVGYGSHVLDIKAGCQTMNGTLALEYSRERHANAQQDLGRIQQQQAVLAGIEKRLMEPGMIFHLPSLLSAAGSAFITDIPTSALPELGVLLGRAHGAATQHLYLDQNGGYVTNAVSSDGQDILSGDWPKINALIASTFTDQQLKAEHASVQVRNGEHTNGLAAIYTAMLQSAGFNTIAPRDADLNTYTRSLIISNTDKPEAAYTVRKLAQMLQATVSRRAIGADHPQIVVILGADVAEGS